MRNLSINGDIRRSECIANRTSHSQLIVCGDPDSLAEAKFEEVVKQYDALITNDTLVSCGEKRGSN